MNGSELLKMRLAKEFTQVQLANEIGYTDRQIRAWEKDVVVIPKSACRILVRVLGNAQVLSS